jgi:Flp pilus assembly protein TadG
MTTEAWRRATAAVSRLGNRGAALVEFAFVLPLLILIITGTLQFGLAMSYYVELVNAVNQGALQFSVSRGTGTPYSGTVTVIDNAAFLLNATTLNSNVTMSVNGTACTSDSSCITLMTAPGLPVQVAGAYPVNLSLVWKSVITLATACSPTTNICASFTETLQ